MQGKDGTAHVTYYNKEHALSFVWDNTERNTVQVSWGGYAEPPLWTFELPDYVPVVSATLMLQEFEHECENWIIAHLDEVKEYVEAL